MAVYLVGAGPGDPELVTVRGLRLVRSCDVLVYDRLVAPELVAHAPAGAELIAREGRSQEEVNELLVACGRTARTVVRLKGGDPFVFGRGGEEVMALVEAGVPFEVVPGVSSLSAVPGSAGIPVTHRGVSTQVTAVTAQAADGGEPDWRSLAQVGGTLVVFMGLGRLAATTRALIEGGAAPSTPAAVVSQGTRPGARTVSAPLAEIAAEAQGLSSPALLVVGEVVALRSQLETRAGTLAAAKA